MIHVGAILHGDRERHLDFSHDEQPVAIQLGGSDPSDLARAASIAEHWGYREVNLNVGCPSERVQRGSFGACLMKEPSLVASCVAAMRSACSIPITVKHRIGLDGMDDLGLLYDFIDAVASAGCTTFIVHARQAILKGLSPKENRTIPPLRYDVVYTLKKDYPDLEIILNGGVRTVQEFQDHIKYVDGVMIGREAYHRPHILSEIERLCFGTLSLPNSDEIIDILCDYAESQVAQGVSVRHISRHVLGLFQGKPGAKIWRSMLSDPHVLKTQDPHVFRRVYEQMLYV
jgi:tRNA-dihydrouridine synthase A